MKRAVLRPVLLGLLLGALGHAMAAPSVQAGFSPEGSALRLVLQTVGEAQQSIRLMGYSFTSPEVAGHWCRPSAKELTFAWCLMSTAIGGRQASPP